MTEARSSGCAGGDASACAEGSAEGGHGQVRSFTIFSNIVLSVTGSVVIYGGAWMKRSGWLLAPILVLFMAAVVTEMIWMVGRTADSVQQKGYQIRSYQDFVGAALGSWGRRLSAVTSTLSLLSMICGSLIGMSQQLQVSLPLTWGGLGSSIEESGKNWWAVLASSTTLLYCFVDIGTLLHGSAWVGIALTVASMVLAYVGQLAQVESLHDFEPSCFDGQDMPYESLSWLRGDNAWENFLSFMSTMTNAIWAFAVVVTLPTLRSTMVQPKKLTRAAGSAFALVCLLLLGLLFLYYAVFGDLGPDYVTSAMRTDRPAGWWATTRPWETGKTTLVADFLSWAFILHMLCSDALFVPCAVVALESWLPPKTAQSWPAWVGLRLFVAFLRLHIAVGVKSFQSFSALCAALFMVCNNIILPTITFYKAGPREQAGTVRRVFHGLFLAMAFVMVIFGCYSSLQDILRDSSEVVPVGAYPRPGITRACKEAYEAALAHGASPLQAHAAEGASVLAILK